MIRVRLGLIWQQCSSVLIVWLSLPTHAAGWVITIAVLFRWFPLILVRSPVLCFNVILICLVRVLRN